MSETPPPLVAKIVRKYRQIGLFPTLKMMVGRTLWRVPWFFFRLKTPERAGVPEQAEVVGKQERVSEFLEQIKGKSFLEIGIGETPSLKRVERMVNLGVDYTGCDFEQVCEYHKAVLRYEGLLKSNIQFAGNRVGTYSRTLFDMVRGGKRFAMVYLDGAHTFYTDLPAFYLAHALLEPGGYFLVDDINWTLSFLRQNMRRAFSEWFFYHRMYSFEDYTPEQQDEKAIQMIAEEILIKQYGYEFLSEKSLQGWWALKKPIRSP